MANNKRRDVSGNRRDGYKVTSAGKTTARAGTQGAAEAKAKKQVDAVTQALSQYDIAISIPLPELVAFTVVAILAGLGAAVVPARRASRLNVLDALHYE